jgi:hypothetical protein
VRWALVGLVFVVGCGRLGFDSDATGDGGGSSDPDARAFTTYRDIVMDDAPLAYWRLGETAGIGHDETSRFDAMFMGTCNPIVGPLLGDDDMALHFDGSSCFAVIASGLEFLGNAPFSIEVWIRDERTDIYQMYFIKETRIGGNPDNGYALLINPSGAYLERIVNQAGQVTNPTAITVNQWVHIVTTYDGAVMSMFYDGVQVGPSKTAPAIMPAVPMTAAIGGFPAGNTFLQGDMDELAIYDHALSPAQIAKHHLIGVDGPIPAGN